MIGVRDRLREVAAGNLGSVLGVQNRSGLTRSVIARFIYRQRRDSELLLGPIMMPNSEDQPSTSSVNATLGLPRRLQSHDLQDPLIPRAVAHSSPGRVEVALRRAIQCAEIADKERAEDILLLDLRGATALVDFFVIVTVKSRRQSAGLASEIDQNMKRAGERKLGLEGDEDGRWTLIDYGDFVVHIFNEESRAYYGLEDIWGDSTRVDWRASSSASGETVGTDSP